MDVFEKRIRPVFADNCQACHNPSLKTAGLDLTTAAGFARGGESGPVVSKQQPLDSLLLKVTAYDGRIKMPPSGKLAEEELAALREWVEQGATWPMASEIPAEISKAGPAPAGRQFTAEERGYWAFQPIRDPEPPPVRNSEWVRTPVDAFILAKLEDKDLEPSPAAKKTTLLRRASYDLTGLPPTEDEIAAFLADESPTAFDRVIERLLHSPRYGEKWGRHWLDVARYADSTGNDEDHRYPYAWRYRDYVIQAFNDDMPFDQFVQEQVAGDLLPAPSPGEVHRRGIIATGFLALGPKAIAQQDKTKMLYDVYDEQLDVLSKAFLGLTVTCARCHDHKFDPIRTRDYYSLIGMFASTRSFLDSTTHVAKLLFTPLVAPQVHQAYLDHQDKIASKKIEISNVIDQQLERYNSELSPRLAAYMLAARRVAGQEGTAGEMARRANLDTPILSKWVVYLKRKDVPRPHLAAWMQADGERLALVGAEYQQRYQTRLRAWSERLAKWREAVRRSLKQKNMPPPKKPVFQAGEDRFFHEVYFAKTGPFALREEDQETVFTAEARARLVELRDERQHLEDTAPEEPPMACAVTEGKTVQQKVFVRGNYESPGEDAPKVFPAILAGDHQTPVTSGSGRLELARWLTGPDQPLTARVMVNRIWQGHFGRGIVGTPSNFGKTGERPTHPELLDYLASRFIESGWSVKQMHRLMMQSSVYQSSSHTTVQQQGADQENRLLSHFQRRRLTVEEMRDGLLAIDGSLDLEMGGTLQSGVGTDRENSNDRLSLSPDTLRRRLVYVPLRRSNLAPLLNLFDFGDATTSTGKRASTNVAPQALFMMNSSFVAERARTLAKTLLGDAGSDAAGRIRRAYLITLNRPPVSSETGAGRSYLASLRKKFPNSIDDLDAWQSFCRILMASNEFLYLE